uniref:C-type lectin domain-containing protein n=1 Tax=Pundamilia nyererei TaxID=303518 RepID=A0A3B4FZH8_9CICH
MISDGSSNTEAPTHVSSSQSETCIDACVALRKSHVIDTAAVSLISPPKKTQQHKITLPERKRNASAVWDHFDLLTANKGISRDDCIAKGGDLVKIDSREEQEFLWKKVRRIMKDHEDKFWIGLTDLAEQGRWLWVDGSPLNESLSYWNYTEPDNWGEDDCVMMGEKSHGYLKSWSDTFCEVSRRSICEKPAAK